MNGGIGVWFDVKVVFAATEIKPLLLAVMRLAFRWESAKQALTPTHLSVLQTHRS